MSNEDKPDAKDDGTNAPEGAGKDVSSKDGRPGEPASKDEGEVEEVDYELEAAVAAEPTPSRKFVARHATKIVIGVLAVCLAAVTAVAAGLWVENNRTIEDAPQSRPTVKLGVPLVNPAATSTSTTTTTRSRTTTTTSSVASTTSVSTSSTTTGSSTSTSTTGTTTSISVPGPTTTSAPRPATKDEEYELTNVLKAFYAALGAKNLDVLNALSCVKITEADLEGQPDDLKVSVDKVEKSVVDGDTASSRVTITATAGGKTESKTGTAGFARISNRWVTCANQ
ncbi:hypothetical protein FZI91_08850 [Mycobacterium sp. CBMA271]|uniref:hypothetical protein n=1 Tax=unclassified Mycobacteroides TaxID=2618759 RepID=UPI0012DC67A1|nr:MULTISPECIES: hypothetical protein [unclassified Mycobacteroides]MUM15544.1 hypothetical protein [Mycobacteroides sp. CBMA 326]MUM17339.1 hypothetical protein [Mycobacteroides sp. CBMA 326]MUM21811.1 hypothetical protein [Mycobacteroides sp. CBMA 271]